MHLLKASPTLPRRPFLGCATSFCTQNIQTKDRSRCEEVWILLDNAEPQISSRLRLEDPRCFQFNLFIDERLEKAQTFTKEDRDDANMDFVNKSGSQALLSGICAAYHCDLFVTCSS